MIIDSHAHYSRHNFDNTYRYLSCNDQTYVINEGNRQDLFDRLSDNHIVASIEPAVEFESNQKLLRFCKQYDGRVFPAIGVHTTRISGVKGKNRKTA